MKFKAVFMALVAAFSLVAFFGPVAAQDIYETDPPLDSTSATGVSYGTGAFTYEVPALSIGPGTFPEGLQLVYSYRSDARAPAAPWTTNFNVRTSQGRNNTALEQGCPPYCKPKDYTYEWNIVVGHRSGTFYKVGAGAGPGPYTSTTLDGSTLVWASTGVGVGKFTYTAGDGAKIVFAAMPTNASSSATPDSWIEPDGTIITYKANSISTNRGLALFFEPLVVSGAQSSQKVCALNLATFYLPSVSTCPPGQPAAIILREGERILSITDSSQGVTSFTYGALLKNGADGHLLCVKEPGQSVCKIQNTFDDCDILGSGDEYDPEWSGSRDRVISQTLGTGETLTYAYTNYHPSNAFPPYACRGNLTASVTQGGATTLVTLYNQNSPGTVQNPLGNSSQMTWVGPANDFADLTRLQSHVLPEGNRVEYTFDARGNITQIRRKAKPGSGLVDVLTTATFPSNCANVFTCNKPSSTTDENGNVSNFTYDPSHGGVLTESGPAVGGVSPRKINSYAQRTAWLKNASGGYSAAAPVWVLTGTISCNSSTLDFATASCAAGASDKIVTAYDYGPDNGPNNLWLRGVAVTADGQTLRTCYGYDGWGRRISETSPNANLASCS